MLTPNLPQAATTIARDGNALRILDQTRLPHAEHYLTLATLDDAAQAIGVMQVRGAPLIGATAAGGLALAMQAGARDTDLARAVDLLAATRPTAVNLQWALARMRERLAPLPPAARAAAAWDEAESIWEQDRACNHAIGRHGLELLARLTVAHGRPLKIMTHCNAGWLAAVAWGTALAPVYLAHLQGLQPQLWVSETRPRNQGLLTAWELARAGVAHTLVADNACGQLLASGQVDVVITGADRIAANGDVANKVGTLLKALAAQAYEVPFYVAAPCSTVDMNCRRGADIPIEQRDAEEVRVVQGSSGACRIAPASTACANPAFDVTPAALLAGIITEHAIIAPGALATLMARPAPVEQQASFS
ncbi:MAG: S-methyl-5-thioribose-1-phosphate isomerase [Rhodocyclaceae bacterium]|nr:S-methyl-5-thioribose-1-phosphate isomerase [Rhodocyclaceae bacterium]MBX3667521.1 S-methyl-5-thioribose-1-phosphate isomerase [Rhodocyclaceae bacterium]